MDLTDQERRALLKDEYLLLIEQYEDFDRRSLQIKGWMAAGAVAAIALGFAEETDAALALPLITAAVAAVVWYIEARWKMFQYGFSDRIRVIEAYFRGDARLPAPEPFQVHAAWEQTYVHDAPIYPDEQGRRLPYRVRLRKAAMQRFVCTLYIAVIGLSLAAFIVLLLVKLI